MRPRRRLRVSPDGRTLAVLDVCGGIAVLRRPDVRADRGATRSAPARRPSRASPTARTGRRSLSAGLASYPPSHRRADARAAGASQLDMAPRAWPSRTTGPSSSSSDRTTPSTLDHVRDAATLEQVGDPIELPRASPAYVGSFHAAPSSRSRPTARSIVTASDDGELTWWDLVTAPKTRTLEIAARLPRARPQPGRSHGGRRRRRRHPAGRPAHRRGADRYAAALDGSPDWLQFSPDGETVVVDQPRRDRDPLGRRVGDSHARPCGATPTPCSSPSSAPTATTLYTVSGDGTAIAWDLTGTAGSGDRSRSRTTARSTRASTGTRGSSAPTAG